MADKDNYNKEKNYKKYLEDPGLAPNIVDDVIDRNLEAIINDSELHENIVVGTRNKEEFDEVNKNVALIFDGLRKVAAEKTEETLKNAMKEKTKGLAKLLFIAGAAQRHKAKIDFLVTKFITNLKTKVAERKDITLKQAQNAFVQDILKKN